MYDFKKIEEDILEFWKEKKIYEKSRKRNAKGKKFYLMDGPPYATGHIHMGTALNKILKDIALRSQRLQGKNVFDRAGYDTHGVPIEYKIEKELKFETKQDIEKFGVKKFIQKCKEYATKFIDVMADEFINLGVWMDFKNPYLTLSNEYIEAIWDVFKIADEKKLLYLGQYPIHICPRCETAVAFNEIEYAKQDDTSVYVKFPLKNRKNTYLLIWTTTPWTLPANTGVMVNPDFNYVEAELSSGEKWILEENLAGKIFAQLGLGYTIKNKHKGKEIKSWEYENPLSKNLNLKTKNAYKVVLSSRYVTNEDGTGLVHCAPGHGKEDYEVGKENNLDMPSPVDISGLLTEEAGKYAGKKARVVDEEIINDLEKDNMLVYKHKYTHDYPLCWRCKSPLLMVSQPQWFLKISGIQKKILAENEKTNWNPRWMKARMKAWLEGVSDWPVSRKRYWGTPLPIWICECGEKKVLGSVKELEKLSKKKIKNIHKPEIDEITIPCKCGKKMKRVPEVLDVWFDSGVSSWAALETKENIKKFWPSDLNIEGKDQVRGWWNSQFILSEIKFEKKPFESILEHGMILSLGKKKMSKSLGNIISPEEIISKYSRDYLRYYFAKTSKGEDFEFKEEDMKEIQSVFRVLINVNNFASQLSPEKQKLKIEDKWILSRFNNLIKSASESYNSYQYPEAVQLLENFIINDLSKTYIQIIRERADETYDILNEIILGLLKILAPIIPFITEKIWQELKERKIVKEESVHLTGWPKADEKKIDRKLEENMGVALKVIEFGLAERNQAGIGLKWPLAKAVICIKEHEAVRKFEEVIKSQLNVKEIEIKTAKESEIKVELDLKMTDELEAEGYARELSRAIQAARKKAGLKKEDKIELEISGKIAEKISLMKELIAQRVGAEKIILTTDKLLGNEDYSEKGKIKNDSYCISFSKIISRR